MKKNILIGITAGIAIYKTCELVRLLKKESCEVKCIMTKDATKFISPILFQELSENQVYTDLFSEYEYSPTHISLSDWADLIVVIPCSCNTIAKLACGKTEDLLSCTIYATDLQKTKVLLCPSMNANMWMHPVTQKNVQILKQIGYYIVEPEEGQLLCGKQGIGKLPSVEKILQNIKELLLK